MSDELRELLVTFALGGGLALIGSIPMTGPLALLVLDRLIAAQYRAALQIALAGALVEGVVATLVATLLPQVLRHSEQIVGYARLSGSLVIFAVGLTLALRPELLASIKTDHKRQSFAAGFLTTALNPTLLATWTVTVTALHANGLLQGRLGVGLVFGFGVAVGALAWFVLVGLLLRSSRPQLLTRHRQGVGRSIGVVLVALGALLFWRAAFSD